MKLLWIYLFILSIFIASISSVAQNSNDCKNFKKGVFTYKEEPFTTVKIKRTKKKQIEHETKSGLIIKYKIIWDEMCAYRLIQTWSNNINVRKLNGSIIKVRITEVGDNSYKYEANQNGIISQLTVIKIE